MLFLGAIEQTNQIEREREREGGRDKHKSTKHRSISIRKKRMVRMHEKYMKM